MCAPGRPQPQVTELRGVNNQLLALVDVTSSLLVNLAIGDIRRSRRSEATPSAAVLRAAGEMFATARLNGLTPDGYCELQSRCAGVPVAVTRRTLHEVAESCAQLPRRVAAERPAGVSASLPNQAG